jgi:two-component system, OmpR family, sensor histidine kinase BaeS
MSERWCGPRSGARPPWWPEGERFPPGDWSRVRRHFLRRVVLAAALFFLFVFVAGALLYHLAAGGGPPGRPGVVPFGFVVAAIVLILLVRSVRGMARPVGDVMEAAGRVAGGDYSARVDERGPPEMRRLARSFNEMTERLAANDRHRRDLLADIAHELRTPLSVIRGNAEAILDGLYPADRAHLEPLLEETVVMARLLDDLRVLSTAEAGVLRLHREPVRPADLAEDAVAAFRAQASERGIRIEARAEPDLPELEVDRVRVGEVLANLLTNALRHTPPGGSVTVSAAGWSNSVAFEVADTGSGIAAEELPHLFDRFVKAADSGGAGLGLAIAKALVEAHGGTISARSELGRGTTMRFELPGGRQGGA